MVPLVAIVLLCILPISLGGQPLLVEASRNADLGPISRIHIAPSGRLYLVSSESNERGWFDRSSGRRYRTGGVGWGLEALDDPRSIWSDALSVFIADRNNHRIVRYDKELRPIFDFRTMDTSLVQARFDYPVGVAVNGRGDMGVLDGESGELIVFDHAGAFLFRVGRDLRAGVTFSEPLDISTDGANRWIVLDQTSVTEIDVFGNLVGREEHGSDEPRAVDADATWLVVGTVSGLVFHSRDHSTHHSLSVGTFNVSYPEARLDDVHLGPGTVTLVLDGEVVRYRMEGFER